MATGVVAGETLKGTHRLCWGDDCFYLQGFLFFFFLIMPSLLCVIGTIVHDTDYFFFSESF